LNIWLIYEHRYNINAKFTKCPSSKEDLKNIYLFKILMKDKSIDQDERFLDAYVFTHDETPSPTVKIIFQEIFNILEFLPKNMPPRLCQTKDLEALLVPKY
jgi:hypothetical protein